MKRVLDKRYENDSSDEDSDSDSNNSDVEKRVLLVEQPLPEKVANRFMSGILFIKPDLSSTIISDQKGELLDAPNPPLMRLVATESPERAIRLFQQAVRLRDESPSTFNYSLEYLLAHLSQGSSSVQNVSKPITPSRVKKALDVIGPAKAGHPDIVFDWTHTLTNGTIPILRALSFHPGAYFAQRTRNWRGESGAAF